MEQSSKEPEIDVSLDNPAFYQKAFSAMIKERKSQGLSGSTLLERIMLEEYGELSRRLDETEMQASSSVRNILKTRQLAAILINDKGLVDKELLAEAIVLQKKHCYALGPGRHVDSLRQEHILQVLTLLQKSKEHLFALQAISKPHLAPYVDAIIRFTLNLSSKQTLSAAHARRAALAAWLCYLRQTLGSCFATAPAIMIHDEQPLQFLRDVSELFATGSIKRTFGGIEYTVPLSVSWGGGELKKQLVTTSEPKAFALEFCKQPGLIAAAEAAGLIHSSAHITERVKKLYELLTQARSNWNARGSLVFTNAEEIMQRLLLDAYNVKKEELEEYGQESKGIVYGSLLMQAPLSKGAFGRKGQTVNQYRQAFEKAKNTFKSLTDNALLRSWEFTIASFAETKAEFTNWNLYSSLGLRFGEPGGIGACIQEFTEQKIEEWNQKVRAYQDEYETAYAQVKFLEGRLRSADSEEQARWYRAEYQSKINEFHTLQEVRDRAHMTAKRFSNFHNQIVTFYIGQFPVHFQEVYDADMLDVTARPFDDSPAGFRLLYKHGRTATAQWTRIDSPAVFIESLASFFTAAEREMELDEQFKGLHQELSPLTTIIIRHVQSKEFIETAFARMAAAHGTAPIENPLENLDRIEKKPWAYTSGGNFKSLIMCYFRRDQEPQEQKRWVESPLELLTFLIDSMKLLPHKDFTLFEKDHKSSVLAYSPTHAFLLKPGSRLFMEAIQEEDHTYIWLRDQLVLPRERFVEEIYLNSDMMAYLIDKILAYVPVNYKPLFQKTFKRLGGSLSVQHFRQHILHSVSHEKGLQFRGKPVLAVDAIDKVLYTHTPLFPVYQLKERIACICDHFTFSDEALKKRVLDLVDCYSARVAKEEFLGPKSLQDVVKALIVLASGKTAHAIDFHREIKSACENLGYCQPEPIYVADTNWSIDRFAFIVNPGTKKFELWRMDHLGIEGEPMRAWEQWLNGSLQEPPWGLFPNPTEYQCH